MKNNYTYPALIQQDLNDDTVVIFPDFKDSKLYIDRDADDCMEEIQDYLSLQIVDYEDNKKSIPKPSKLFDIKKSKGEIIFINIWMPYQRAKTKIMLTKKTLTIPSWIDVLAKEKNLNFSQVLTKALKKELGIE